MASSYMMTLRPVATAPSRVANSVNAIRPLPRRVSSTFMATPLISRSRSSRGTVRATELDFDTVLADIAEKFERVENKPVVVGYSVGAVLAIFSAEYIIHLPLFNVLLGFPIQLLGLLSIPYLGIRYIIEEEDASKDAINAVEKVIAQLPGLDK